MTHVFYYFFAERSSLSLQLIFLIRFYLQDIINLLLDSRDAAVDHEGNEDQDDNDGEDDNNNKYIVG